jgi:hypothetical protein
MSSSKIREAPTSPSSAGRGVVTPQLLLELSRLFHAESYAVCGGAEWRRLSRIADEIEERAGEDDEDVFEALRCAM